MPSEKKQKKYVVANWKMNPGSLADATRLVAEVKKVTARAAHVQTILCAPALYLSGLSDIMSGNRTVLGAQNCHYERSGPFTGEISPSQLLSLGVHYVILGHSERRAMGETNELVAKKVAAALKEGLQVILCIGESERDSEGNYLNVVKQQIEEIVGTIPRRYFLNLMITYEPIWAISSHVNPGQQGGAHAVETAGDMLQMSIFIRKVLAGIAGKDLASKLPILYGGSADERNARDFILEGGADGLLVGKASLFLDSFIPLIKSVNEAAAQT